MTRRALGTALIASLASVAACSNVLGLKDFELDPENAGDGAVGVDGSGSVDTGVGNGDGGTDAPLGDGAHVDGTANDGTIGDGPPNDGTVTDTTPTDTSMTDTSMTDTSTPDTSVGCEAGQIMCNATCVDTSTNVSNCGSCNHDCLGGGCTGSVCQPVRLAFAQSSPWDLAVDATSVYFTNGGNGTVMKCATSGCGGAPTTLASLQIAPERITLDATYVYWTDYGDGTANGAVRRVKKDGTLLLPLSSALVFPEGVAVDPSFAYFAIRTSGGAVRNVPIGGGSTTTTTAHNTPTTVVSDGAALFFGDEGGALTRCTPVAGACASTTPLYSGTGGIFGIGVDATHIYFATLASSGIVLSALKSNGTSQQTLAAAQPWPVRLATDGVDVVWANRGVSQGVSNDGSIMRCAVGGCGGNPVTVASSQGDPHGVAIDAKAIYWANANDGTIWKVAR